MRRTAASSFGERGRSLDFGERQLPASAAVHLRSDYRKMSGGSRFRLNVSYPCRLNLIQTFPYRPILRVPGTIISALGMAGVGLGPAILGAVRESQFCPKPCLLKRPFPVVQRQTCVLQHKTVICGWLPRCKYKLMLDARLVAVICPACFCSRWRLLALMGFASWFQSALQAIMPPPVLGVSQLPVYRYRHHIASRLQHREADLRQLISPLAR